MEGPGATLDNVSLIKQVLLSAFQTSIQLSPGGHTGVVGVDAAGLRDHLSSHPRDLLVLSYRGQHMQAEGSETLQALILTGK